MESGRRIRSTALRVPLLLLACAFLLTGLLAAATPPVLAQEGTTLRPWLRNLFAPSRRSERLEPIQGIPGAEPKAKAKAKARKPAKPKEPEIAAVEKAPDARVVLIVGDFLASGLAEGLTVAYAQNPAVRIVDRSKGSSGFVRQDVYDWPAEIGAVIEAEKPAAVVVMLGSNDRQQMRVGDAREPARSDSWNKEYERRTDTLGNTIAETKVPMFWVGLPAFKPAKMSTDMLAFNDIYRDAAEMAGGEFVDIWDGFVDETGAFISTGPDINGQPVRLRANDGINLTAAGKRKLAFYLEKPLAKIVGSSPATAAGGTITPASLAPALPGETAPRIDTGVPISLNDPELDGGTELLGGDAGQKPGDRLADEMNTPPAPGRADDFSWPQRQPPVAAGGVPASTTAIAR